MEFYHHLTIFEEEIYGKNYLDLKEANYKYSDAAVIYKKC